MPRTKEAVKELSAHWPTASAKLIEDKANGPAVIQELRHDVSGLIEVNPEGGKIARAHAVSPQVESGNTYLPHPAIAPWVEEFIEEVAAFPNSRHDDQVDAMTQALNRLRATSANFFVPESQIMVDPFPIPETWPRAFGMAVTPNVVAALWGARDPGGTIYLDAEHRFPHAEPSQNARAIKAAGGWIPGVVNLSALKGSQAEKNTIVHLYYELGLNIEIATAGEEAGVYQLWQLLALHQLKVFSSLSGFLAEYRIGHEQSPLLLSCHALLLSGRQCMRTKPIKATPELSYAHYGPNGWMG
jgi:predicted phage terminase large subunit-like protein